MGKHRRLEPSKKSTQNGLKSKNIKRRQHSQVHKSSLPQQGRHVKQTGHRGPVIKLPFTTWDKILCVGEGNFSYALSLAQHHQVHTIVATSYDPLEALKQKYENVDTTLEMLAGGKNEDNKSIEAWQGFSDNSTNQQSNLIQSRTKKARHVFTYHGVDATALAKTKVLGQHAPFNKVIFNFPHTGGITTDVNRQVRANQDLLVSFFKSVRPYLATTQRPSEAERGEDESDLEYDSMGEEIGAKDREAASKCGRIMVTLFEGEPYTLWNIRDLARHCGLQVVESFKFPWAAFPGYQHARTIGDITTGKDRSDEGKRKGAWRGEERLARCYCLALKEENMHHVGQKKRKRNDNSDDSE